jgi:cysteine desulfuration protein SufE
MSDLTSIDGIREEYEFLEPDDRYRLLIDLGKALEPMPEALQTDVTLVRGCLSKVWTYPTRNSNGSLHFLADSNSAITKGIIALVLTIIQDKQPSDILAANIEGTLQPFEVERYLSSNRTSGIPNMIALIRETAGRLASQS